MENWNTMVALQGREKNPERFHGKRRKRGGEERQHDSSNTTTTAIIIIIRTLVQKQYDSIFSRSPFFT